VGNSALGKYAFNHEYTQKSKTNTEQINESDHQ